MNDKRPKAFDKLFTTFIGLGNVYDHVDERKDYLVEKLLDPTGAVLPLVRVYPKRGSTDKVLDFLNKWVETNGTENSISEFSSNTPSVSFRLKNGTPVFSDYICVEYFRLYTELCLVRAHREIP